MPTYAYESDWEGKVPAGVPSSFSTNYLTENPEATTEEIAAAWTAKKAEIISRKSAKVDVEVGTGYPYAYNSNTQKFPDVSENPSTPETIREICGYFCIIEIMGIFAGVNRGRSSENEQYYRKRAEEKLNQIRKGEIVIDTSANTFSPAVGGYEDRERVFTEDNMEYFGRLEE